MFDPISEVLGARPPRAWLDAPSRPAFVLHYYIYQVFPNPCSMGGKESADMLREVQRTLPRLFSNMRIMSTVGVTGGSAGLCHWDWAATANFYLDRIGSRVTSASAIGKVIKLQVTGATTNQTIDYVVDQFWGGSAANLLTGLAN